MKKYFTENEFTLIELLIVISIIAILISILLPALGSARDKAHNLSCMSAMKSLGTAGTMYANAYNEVWIPYDGGTQALKWYQNAEFHRELGFKTYSMSADWSRDFIEKKYLCPESTRPLAETWMPSGWQRLSFTYAVEYLNGELLPGKTSDEFRFYRLNKIRAASRKIAFTETTQSGRNTMWKMAPENLFWKTGNESGSDFYGAYRHNKKMAMNVTFFDGHVENRNHTKLRVDDAFLNLNKMQWFPYDNCPF